MTRKTTNERRTHQETRSTLPRHHSQLTICTPPHHVNTSHTNATTSANAHFHPPRTPSRSTTPPPVPGSTQLRPNRPQSRLPAKRRPKLPNRGPTLHYQQLTRSDTRGVQVNLHRPRRAPYTHPHHHPPSSNSIQPHSNPPQPCPIARRRPKPLNCATRRPRKRRRSTGQGMSTSPLASAQWSPWT